ncbi:glycosyltransferase 61 family protein [Eilatimonas milleporae]|uniref:Uncharacterized protein DUF563 n=1 Tax=Eilatimonas milleporae TaxID=911205 RepID=A0A3M0C2M3_9PROT|nr:glycosyltransferase 61 family protein [Eilatimonas milleporae]RMB01419.1 uncharacterized protein DUF563 [Eilatimonas milleporae]
MAGLRYAEFENVALAPFEKLLPRLRGGLAAPEGLPDFCRHRRWGKPRDEAVRRDLSGSDRLHPDTGRKFVFGGIAHWHFGHMAAEFLHRLWILREPGFETATVLFLGPEQPPQLFREYMAYFGVSSWMTTDKPCVVTRLTIPEQGKTLGQTPHPDYESFLNDLADRNGVNRGVGPEKLAVLRGHVPGRRFIGEASFESYLSRQGYVNYKPENHALTDQLRTVSTARQLVISDGSACHLFDLLPKCRMKTALISRAAVAGPKTRDTLATRKSLADKSLSLSVFTETSRIAGPDNDGRQGPTALRYVPLDCLIDFLKEHGFIPPEAPGMDTVPYFEDFRDYAARHLMHQGRSTETHDVMIELLAKALHEKNMQIEALEQKIGRPTVIWQSIKVLASEKAKAWLRI